MSPAYLMNVAVLPEGNKNNQVLTTEGGTMEHINIT